MALCVSIHPVQTLMTIHQDSSPLTVIVITTAAIARSATLPGSACQIPRVMTDAQKGAPPGSKCVQEQQIGVYRGGKENGYIFAVYRTNCGGWSISQTELGFWQVNFTSPCGVPVTGGGFSTDDLIDVEPLTACSEKKCGPCGCDRYANGGSTAYC